MTEVEFEKKIAFDVLKCIEDLNSLTLQFNNIQELHLFRRALIRLQFLKDSENNYLLGKYYDEYKKQLNEQ